GVFEPAPESKVITLNKVKYYQKIDLVLNEPPATRVRFLLIPRGDKSPFYMMQDKVWYDLFASFAKSHPKLVHADSWEQEKWAARYSADHEQVKLEFGPDRGKLPALGVRFQDAHHFADWVGGQLPTVDHWDAASGKNFKLGSSEKDFDLDRAKV